MKKTTNKNKKILIQWIEMMPDGSLVIQTRKYNDEEKADRFVDTLPERNVTTCTKKTTETINFVDELAPIDNQLSMKI